MPSKSSINLFESRYKHINNSQLSGPVFLPAERTGTMRQKYGRNCSFSANLCSPAVPTNGAVRMAANGRDVVG